jgi:hypothetical protein
METFTDEHRAAVARGWAESGLTQDEYAARFGVAGRTLRLWLGRYATRQRPLVQARAIVEDAIQRLQAVLGGLDAEVACLPEPGDDPGPSDPAFRSADAQQGAAVQQEPVGAVPGGLPSQDESLGPNPCPAFADRPADPACRAEVDAAAPDAELADAVARERTELTSAAAPVALTPSPPVARMPRLKTPRGWFADPANWT